MRPLNNFVILFGLVLCRAQQDYNFPQDLNVPTSSDPTVRDTFSETPFRDRDRDRERDRNLPRPDFPESDPNNPRNDLNYRDPLTPSNDPLDPYGNRNPNVQGDPYGRGENRDPTRDGTNTYGGGNDFDFPQRPPWQDPNRGVPGYREQDQPTPLEHESVIINEATYFIVASRIVRPGQIYKLSVNILKARLKMTIRASISNNGVEQTAASEKVKEGTPEVLNLRVPPTSVPGEYKLRVEGLYLDDPFGGKAFINETLLTFSRRFMTIFIQMDKPVYMQGQTVYFRTIPINTELKAFNNAIDLYILDPKRRIMKRWLSRQSNFGTVSLDYKLSDQPVFGEWIIQVIALGQVEESTFLVEEYYQTRFEVNVTMPAFFFNSDPYIYGRVMANYTSGAPVRGNLTLKATIRPIPQFRPWYYQQGQFNNQGQFGLDAQFGNEQYTRGRFNQNQFRPNIPLNGTIPYQQQPFNTYGSYREVPQYDARGNPIPPSLYIPGMPNQLNQPGYVYDYTKVVERHFNFDEKFPFWMTKPDLYNTGYYTNFLPYLRFFNGTFEFLYPMRELEQFVPTLDGMEVIITATVGERFLDEIIEGYSIARVFNSSIKIAFLGGSPQVFKPAMPFDCYIAASFHDGSILRPTHLATAQLDIQASAELKGGGRRDLPIKAPMLDPSTPGIWHLKIDLKSLLGLDEARNAKDTLNDVRSVRLLAFMRDGIGGRAHAELQLLAHHSPRNQHIKVSTSTGNARVGEYIVFHVQSNFYMERFDYLVMSKGIILTTGQENMQETVRTFAVTLSAEMAPAATVVVWSAGRHGNIVADSLTFPVNGISRNNFTVYINNRKARTGHRVEVAIYGEPGAYVGLSGIDNAFYTMQAGNELTYAKVITKMATFDEQTNGTFKHTWLSHQGNPDELVYFASSSFGIDANRTFEYTGLVVFTDVAVSRRPLRCNNTQGLMECLSGQCYIANKHCDGIVDCDDGTDETACEKDYAIELAHFRKFRFNRIQRQYENVWLWRDANIGPHGRYVFSIDVPKRPAAWTISAFSVSPTMGFGMLKKPLEYYGVLPFFLLVEGPRVIRQGEQVGLRAIVFNYMDTAIEATVVLTGSPDYKFVHVEEHGIVRSYNPRTSYGEHQFFVYIPSGDAATVHLPVVPQRLGEIKVTIHAGTLIGRDTITHTMEVEADGLPQYRHQSILLDLSNRAYVFQYLHVNVTETPIIPYDVDRYYVFGSNKARVSIVGDVVGPIFPTMPVNATSLISLPMDSAEQNMFSFAANLYTTMYMRLINQRNRTTEKWSFYNLNILYQRQLSFMKRDGSFSYFRSDWNQSDSSVWLTAFCARIFQDAAFYEWENYIYIDPEIISKSIMWILDHQTPEGSFFETTWLSDRKVNSSLSWGPTDPIAQRNISLTAHVIITLETVKDLKDLSTIGRAPGSPWDPNDYNQGYGQGYSQNPNNWNPNNPNNPNNPRGTYDPNNPYDTPANPNDPRYRQSYRNQFTYDPNEQYRRQFYSGGLSARAALAQQRAASWLERNMPLIAEHGQPYDAALVAYALMLSKSSNAEAAFSILAKHARSEGGLTYWGKEKVPAPPYKLENQKPFLLPRLPYKYDSINIETTAYALMTYTARQELMVDPIVMWLNAQRLTDGGWASTQDTCVAMKALIEYTTRKRIRDVSQLSVSVEATALPGQTKMLYVNNKNIAVLQSIDIPQAWGTVKVQAKGAGYAILQMSVQYNVDIEKFQTAPPVRSFELHTRANFYGRNQSHIEYQSCQRWTHLNESIRSGMAVLDVAIPTGYIIQQQKLDAYILSRRVRNLQRAKFLDRKVLFYFDFLDHEDTCVNFTVERWFPVANMSRYLPIRVYDYYAPERFNETIFDALPTYLLNICEVCGSSQCPYCSIYASASARAPTIILIFVTALVVVFFQRRNYDFNPSRSKIINTG